MCVSCLNQLEHEKRCFFNCKLVPVTDALGGERCVSRDEIPVMDRQEYFDVFMFKKIYRLHIVASFGLYIADR